MHNHKGCSNGMGESVLINDAGIMSLFKRMGRLTHQYVSFNFPVKDLSAVCFPYLKLITLSKGISIKEISAQMKVDKANTSRIVNEIISKGYARKQSNELDKRAIKIHPTQKTLDLLESMKGFMENWRDILIKDLTENELNYLLNGLSKILKNAEEYVEEHISKSKESK